MLGVGRGSRHGRLDRSAERSDALLKRQSGRGLKPIAKSCVVDVQIDRFWPQITFGGIADGSDYAATSRVAVDLFREFNRADGAHGLDDRFSQAGLLRPVQFV